MKQFGGKVTKKLIERYGQSPNWDGEKFINLEETTMQINFHTLPELLYKQFFEKEGREPNRPIPIQSFDQEQFLAPSDRSKFIWYGHSVVLIRISGKTILIDPMLGPDASPIAPFATKRFSENSLGVIGQLPEIDLMLLTHDHYDHLDVASIKKLKSKTSQYFVALGVKRHLTHWGLDESIISEFDWWDEIRLDDITITFTPSRHFSGRGLSDRAKSLWGGWVLQTSSENIYFSGDGGYGQHFKEIGKKLGPFDFGFMECGQYNENWHQIHMYPEESVKAAIDAGVKITMPVHWGGFSLAQHTWKDPIERFTKSSVNEGLEFITPAIGELFNFKSHKSTSWWDNYD